MRNTEDIVVSAILLGCAFQLIGCILAWGLPGLFFGLAYACVIILLSHWLARVLEAIEKGRE